MDRDVDPRQPKARNGWGESTSLDLLRRAREGNREALDLLLGRYVPLLRRWTSGRLPRWARDMVDTDDMVQDALIGTFRHVDHFEPRHDGALLAYMRRILLNRIRDELRKAKRRPAREETLETPVAPTASPLEETIGREALERYELALDRLEPAAREAIVCRVEMGLSYARIARSLGKPSPDAARMAVSRALVLLAQEMGHGPA